MCRIARNYTKTIIEIDNQLNKFHISRRKYVVLLNILLQ